jgi:ABC-type lipoprotein release transport system permease subunit
MKTLLMIAFRNLFRQKRRNLFLGSAIGFGAMILLIANSFSHGISRTLINEVVAYVAGHANVGFADQGRLMSQVMRGGAHWKDDILKIPGVKKVDPTMGVFGRAIGNGRSDNVFLVAMNMREVFTHEDSVMTENNFPMTEGTWDALLDSTLENPLILSVEKAKYLNVKMGDVVRMRLQDFNGSYQAIRLTVAGIFQPSNIFMESALFMELKAMSLIMGLRPEDSPYLYLTIENPAKNAINIADSIWRMMAPPLAYMEGHTNSTSLLVSGYRSDSSHKAELWKRLGGTLDSSAFGKKVALFPKLLADSLQLKIGDTLQFRYAMRFPDTLRGDSSGFRIIIGGLYPQTDSLPNNLVLLNEVNFYDKFYDALPKVSGQSLALDSSSFWFQSLTTEWIRLPRPRTTDDVSKQKRDVSQHKYKGTTLTISTMYESASAVLQLESALQIITLSAVLVIFLITLIGVVNTLRMTIRERTREIGTLRAIGMQSSDVRMVFLLETGLLAFFSALIGTLFGFFAMWGLSLLTIPTASNPLGIILVKGHLVFAPTFLSVSTFIILIVAIAIATAWFPANRASKLPAATALRHYE